MRQPFYLTSQSTLTFQLVCVNPKSGIFIIIILYNQFLRPFSHDHPFLYTPLIFASYSFCFQFLSIIFLSGGFCGLQNLFISTFLNIFLVFLHFWNDGSGQDGIRGWQWFSLSILKTHSITSWLKYCGWEVCCPNTYCFSVVNSLIFNFRIRQFHHATLEMDLFFNYSPWPWCFFKYD